MWSCAWPLPGNPSCPRDLRAQRRGSGPWGVQHSQGRRCAPVRPQTCDGPSDPGGTGRLDGPWWTRGCERENRALASGERQARGAWLGCSYSVGVVGTKPQCEGSAHCAHSIDVNHDLCTRPGVCSDHSSFIPALWGEHPRLVHSGALRAPYVHALPFLSHRMCAETLQREGFRLRGRR